MKRFWILFLVLFLPAIGARAQQPSVSLTSQQKPVRLSVQSSYQRYVDGDRTISLLSFPITAFVPIGQNLSVGLRTSIVTAKQRGRLSGLNDANLSLSYTRSMGSGSFVFNVNVNLPTGKEKLSPEEYETAVLLARDVYSFRVSSLGQGFNISPSLTWAQPLGDNVVAGLGVAYQYRGGYEPRKQLDANYNPGNEVLLTGGLDYRLGSNFALSGDVTYTLYGIDTISEADYYEAGNKTTATLQLLKKIGFDEVRLVGRYRNRASSHLSAVAQSQIVAEEQYAPDQFIAIGSYRKRLSKVVYLTGLLRGRHYGKTSYSSQQMVYEFGIRPEFAFAGGLHLRPHFMYTLASFSGIEAGLNVSVRF